MKRLDHAGGLVNRKITAFGGTLDGKPSEIFKRHVWVAPFPEEDVPGLASADRRGPCADGLGLAARRIHSAAARLCRHCLEGMSQADIQKIMRNNIQALIGA